LIVLPYGYLRFGCSALDTSTENVDPAPIAGTPKEDTLVHVDTSEDILVEAQAASSEIVSSNTDASQVAFRHPQVRTKHPGVAFSSEINTLPRTGRPDLILS
jgi:hypothetical protein